MIMIALSNPQNSNKLALNNPQNQNKVAQNNPPKILVAKNNPSPWWPKITPLEVAVNDCRQTEVEVCLCRLADHYPMHWDTLSTLTVMTSNIELN